MKAKSKLAAFWGLAVLLWFLGGCNPYYHGDTFPDPCSDNGDSCHAPSLKIWKAFLRSTGLDGISLPGVYCGTCFHEGDYHNPYYPHRGVVLIDQKNGRRYFDALFSFYPEENSCCEQDIDSIRNAMIPTLYSAAHEINWNRDVAWVLLNPGVESSHMKYYIRKKQTDDDRLFLIGIWKGEGNRVFCRLKRIQ